MMDQSTNYYSFDPNDHLKKDSSTYACCICAKTYNYVQCLRRHVFSVHINRAYISPSDLSLFDLKLGDHHERTASPKMYCCNTCKTLCKDSENLSKHLASQHSVSTDPSTPERVTVIQCPDCDSKFTKMSSLNCHMRYHRNGWTANGRSSASLAVAESSPIAQSSSPSAHTIIKTSSSQFSKISKKKSVKAATKKTGKGFSTLTGRSKGARDTLPARQKKSKNSVKTTLTSRKAKTTQKKSAHSKSMPSKNLATPSNLTTDAQFFSKGRQLRQRTSMQKNASVFTCTVCRKPFHSYGNMLRHRRLSHELVTRKRPDMIHIRRKAKRSSKFSDPKKARKYFNKVASDIAFNLKNCIHGNAKHLTLSSNCIRPESKTNLLELRANMISKKTMNLFNIKTKYAATLSKGTAKVAASKSKAKQSRKSEELTETMEEISQESKSPDVYDKPGLWKYLCLVCLQYFPNTLELFTHQDTVHKRINVGYMEVGKSYDLPLHSVATLKPLGCIPASSGQQVVCAPSKYTCTKCHAQFKSSAELHPHIITCGKALIKPLQIRIPDIAFPELTCDNTYGKVKGKKMHWQRDDVSMQRKLTDMDGFNVRKRKRLVMEVKEQERLERLRAMNGLSPDNSGPASDEKVEPNSVLENRMNLKSESQSSVEPQSHEKIYKFRYSCPYCTITFKYGKVYERHINNKCEMMKRISSPEKSDETNEEEANSDAVAEIKEDPVAEKSSKGELMEDIWSPQKSLAQARVLSKFIHPARTCGPCYACKKPNMTRRYSHLKQRSEAFVEFVMSKCKNISLQSCICKACELNFKRDYDKRKEKKEKYSLCKKVHTKTKSKRPSGEVKESATGVQKPSLCSSRGTGQTSDKKVSRSKEKELESKESNDGHVGRYRTRSKLLPQDKPLAMTSVGKRRSTKAVTTKSLEQIFPEDEQDCNPSSRSQLTPNSVQDIQSRTTTGSLYLEHDIIDVEKEMIVEETQSNKSKEAMQEKASSELTLADSHKIVSSPCNVGVFTPDPASDIIGDLDAPDSSEDRERLDKSLTYESTDQTQNDARLKVILQFVKDSANSKKLLEGKKLTLTEIVDAVTEKVKEDPRLAVTLTKAIESACGDSSKAETARSRGSGKAHASKSLPAVLDGLAIKTADPNGQVKNILRTGYIGDAHKLYQQQTTSPLLSPSTDVKQSGISQRGNSLSNLDSQVLSKETLVTPDNFLPTSEKAPVAPVSSAASVVSNTKQAAKNVTPCDTNVNSENDARERSNDLHLSAPILQTKARKRCSSDSTSSSSHASSSNIPRKKFIMTKSSYAHMVEIIDAVACGDINPPSSPQFDDDSLSINSSEGNTSRYSYDFMLDVRDNYDCIRTAEQTSTSSHPGKNLRLANIISKLASGTRDERKQTPVVSSPTSSQNPNSIDSGFTSLAG